MDPHDLNRLSFLTIQCAIEVHRALGPGLLEHIYRICLIYELQKRGLAVVSEQHLPIRYRDVTLDGAYRLDLIIENQLIVEVKAIETVLPVHSAQLLSYLRLASKPLGLLINFNVPVLIKGVTRLMNGAHDAALRTKSGG